MLDRDVQRLAVEKYGIRAQMDILVEEMSELTKELMKCSRKANATGLPYELSMRVFDEMIDAENMIQQLQMIIRGMMGEEIYQKEYRNRRGAVMQTLLDRIRRES